MDFSNSIFLMTVSKICGSTSSVVFPAINFSIEIYFPFSFSMIFTSLSSAFCDFINPSPALVSFPSLYAISIDGPTLFLSRSCCFSAIFFTITATLLGVLKDSISENEILSFVSSSVIIFFKFASVSSTYLEGSSSNPISKRKSM